MPDLKDTLKTGRAAESSHWYTQDGMPAYTVKAKAGHDRATTLRDARKLELVPSVTTIIKAAAAPALEVWKQNQVLLAALTLPKELDETDDEWCKRIMADSKEHAINAAAKGTEIHAAIQGVFEGKNPPPEYEPHVVSVDNSLEEWASALGANWEPEVSFAHPMGFGGKCDLSAECCAGNFVVDFKTKEFAPDDKLKTWANHAMQLAAYRIGLDLPDARCAILYVSVSNPGHAQLVEIKEDELQRGWAMFEALLNYWKAQKKFEPGWVTL